MIFSGGPEEGGGKGLLGVCLGDGGSRLFTATVSSAAMGIRRGHWWGRQAGRLAVWRRSLFLFGSVRSEGFGFMSCSLWGRRVEGVGVAVAVSGGSERESACVSLQTLRRLACSLRSPPRDSSALCSPPTGGLVVLQKTKRSEILCRVDVCF